jgi:hypothetical protein
MTPDEIPLCICHHFRDQHIGPQLVCSQCPRCMRFQPVSSKSSHVYQRGLAHRVVKKRFDQLHVGDWVVVHYNGADMGLAVAIHTADALLAQITVAPTRLEPAPENRYRSYKWVWEATTDLGALGPYLGQTQTMTVRKGEKW